MLNQAYPLNFQELGIVTRGLVACYDFQGGGNKLIDRSGNGNHGQLGSTAGADINDPPWIPPGLRFDGDDYVDCGDLKVNVLSLQMVEYFPAAITKSSTQNFPIWFRGKSSDFIGYGSTTSFLTNEIISISHNNGARCGWCDDVAQISQGWHFIEYVWDENKYRIILDRNEKNVTVYGTPQVLFANGLLLGYRSGILYTGTLAYFLPYSNKLKDVERTQNYQALKRILAGRGVQI